VVVHGVAVLLLGVNERDKEIFTSVERRLGIRVPMIRRVISFGRSD
jgi:hypothetical protein